MKFKINDRVIKTSNIRLGGNLNLIGTVIYLTPGPEPMYEVKWDWSKRVESCHEEYLLSEEEALNQQSKLEEAFDQIQNEIKEKMKAAAELIRAANKLAVDNSLSLVDDMSNESDVLLSAMDDAGWRTSSLGC